MAIETKDEARRRNRKELLASGIKLGCRKPESAKAKNRIKFERTGVRLVCGKKADACVCDDRSAWMRERV